MPRLPSVNDALWMHFSRGGRLAALIRGHVSNWRRANFLGHLSAFFDSSDDHERLVQANRVARILLRRHDSDYLLPLWDLVRRLEDQRWIKYKKQTGHTAHSLYLYLLGVWLFDNSEAFRKQYVAYHVPPTNTRPIEESFSLQWLFASLLHDIGYVFGVVSEDGNDDAQRSHTCLTSIDKLFGPSSLKVRFPYVSSKTRESVAREMSAHWTRWTNTGEIPLYSTASTPADILRELDKAPWLKDLIPSSSGCVSEAFEACGIVGRPKIRRSFRPSGRFLKQYAEQVARNGYKQTGLGTVDHAYASGCLLFQLSSFKYWTVLKCGAEHQEELGARNDPKRFPGFGYSAATLKDLMLPACHAAAGHNVLSSVPLSNSVIPLRLADSPLLFLSVLCDELQKWHRPPVGSDFSDTLTAYRPLAERDVYLDVGSHFWDYRIGFGCNDKRAIESILTPLFERLAADDIKRIVLFRGEGDRVLLQREILEAVLRPEGRPK